MRRVNIVSTFLAGNQGAQKATTAKSNTGMRRRRKGQKWAEKNGIISFLKEKNPKALPKKLNTQSSHIYRNISSEHLVYIL